ncbi:helix-turn-helix transcriptional regulator [Novosphingobium ginsenosidimutans]|uniref:Helix-turn-helix transcriptional regulator n=1 Tax=Novosphingobium ginsenosidimutans TaxID=1176536 RepID=A0A5B8S157_9SPHN|nr:helix-turn-helix transcriptional regulator [Novosphingobium ginsenosidimutans]QEA14868.1 helix-turn-helix transcriptional regulator [Novosphingobium ginsenosidimutans]
MTNRVSQIRQRRDRQALLVAGVVAVQAVAAVFFVADALGDFAADGVTAHILIEALIAFALLAGVFVGAAHVRRLLAEAQQREQALDIARGALSEHIAARFADWGLTAAESDVALFALKGCDAAEIAALRGAAQGTVRAQLSQVYAKAGVTSQAGLVSLFLEDLL